jgi:hypothetical protein
VKTIRVCILALVTITTTTPAKPQQPKPAAPPTQAQLQQQIDELKKRLDDAELKAKSAELDKDYLTRIQKQYETYYEKVLSTQTTTVALVGILITVLLALAGRIGFNTFERLTQSAIRDATTQLRTEYNQTLATEVQKLKDSNEKDMGSLSEDLRTEIKKEANDLRIISRWNLQVGQAYTLGAEKRHDESAGLFRRATAIYKETKDRKVLRASAAVTTIANTLVAVGNQTPDQRKEKIREELSNSLYDDLENELALTAATYPEYAQAIKERQNPSPTPAQPQAATQTTTAEAPPPPATAEPDGAHE